MSGNWIQLQASYLLSDARGGFCRQNAPSWPDHSTLSRLSRPYNTLSVVTRRESVVLRLVREGRRRHFEDLMYYINNIEYL